MTTTSKPQVTSPTVVLNRNGRQTILSKHEQAAWLTRNEHRTRHDWNCGGGCYGVIVEWDTAWVIAADCPTHRGQVPVVPIVSVS